MSTNILLHYFISSACLHGFHKSIYRRGKNIYHPVFFSLRDTDWKSRNFCREYTQISHPFLIYRTLNFYFCARRREKNGYLYENWSRVLYLIVCAHDHSCLWFCYHIRLFYYYSHRFTHDKIDYVHYLFAFLASAFLVCSRGIIIFFSRTKDYMC